MRFGSREVADVVFRAKGKQTLGSRTFYKDEPVLYFDTLKTSGLEGASTTVYAQGGRGNPRLIAWEGERTMTFTMEDALISPEGLAILTGADLLSAGTNELEAAYVHNFGKFEVGKTLNDDSDVRGQDCKIEIPGMVCYTGVTENQTAPNDSARAYVHKSADVFVMILKDGVVISEPCAPKTIEHKDGYTVLTCDAHEGATAGTIVMVDYYEKRTANVRQIEITADKFGGYYYIEASTLFRDEASGQDLPAEFIIPNGKVQSNFNFAMANSGDPSTFTFTVDAMPGYTKFDGTKKVLAVIQVIEDAIADAEEKRKACDGEIKTTETPDSEEDEP